jgi:required for meiotic nuclear division protein 1
MKISAYYIAEQIALKPLRETFAGTLLLENPSELFYRQESDQYMYVFDYGVVVFANMSDVDVSKNLSSMRQFYKNPFKDKIFDDFEIIYRPDQPLTFHFDYLVTTRIDEEVIKIVMLNIAQSVALDFYSERSQMLLREVRQYSDEMEQLGTIRISNKNMLRFIGRTLNSKNKVVENFFIFDAPDQTWEDEYLEKIHRGLTRTLELQPRFREIEYTFKIVEDNLAVFREFFMHRESSRLEWIIIVLICIEVGHLIFQGVSNFFK